jgi:Histidine kinase-, DNA gyrase B-, and HSP90-like ATPase
MVSDALLSELERQEKYLAQLPEDYEFPLFNARQAVESQRRSGYKDTAAASREIVDNAIEARATRVDVVFDTVKAKNGKQSVTAVAFIDNGSGMSPRMARYALSWGGGTHFEDPEFIGRFGFGLPNSSINQTRRVEVYTRTSGDQAFTRAYLDITSPSAFGTQSIPPHDQAPLPGFVQQYIGRNKLTLDHGTVVVWVNPDRLTYRSPAHLKEHLVDDFGVTYRYLLQADGHDVTDRHVRVVVEGVKVEAVDPLFVLPGARLYVPPENGGSQLIEDMTLPVRFAHDPETGEKRLTLVENSSELASEEPGSVVSTIQVRIARFPVGFAVFLKGKGDKEDHHRRFDIRKTRRGMSFVRSGRELQTVDVFPRSPHDVASGLGDWPLLQGYAYHWGVEVRFRPDLDEVFGITNDKQGVRPIEDFWRVLVQKDIDQAVRREQRNQETHRKRKTAEDATPDDDGTPTQAEQAAQAADVALGDRPRIPERHIPQARDAAEHEAEQRAKREGTNIKEAREALEKETRRRRHRVTYFDQDHGPFYEPAWRGSQLEIKVNRRHPFYEVFYADLLRLPGGARAKAALDLVLLTLARTEMTVEEDDMELWFSAQRKHLWSPFLDTALRSLVQRLDSGDEDEIIDDIFGTEDVPPVR